MAVRYYPSSILDFDRKDVWPSAHFRDSLFYPWTKFSTKPSCLAEMWPKKWNQICLFVKLAVRLSIAFVLLSLLFVVAAVWRIQVYINMAAAAIFSLLQVLISDTWYLETKEVAKELHFTHDERSSQWRYWNQNWHVRRCSRHISACRQIWTLKFKRFRFYKGLNFGFLH